MIYALYTQLQDGTVMQLHVGSIESRAKAREMTQAFRIKARSEGEDALIRFGRTVPRSTYRASLGQTSVWYEVKK